MPECRAAAGTRVPNYPCNFYYPTCKGGLHFTVICCTNKCIINERYIPEHQNKLNIYDLQNYEFFCDFFSAEKNRILDLWITQFYLQTTPCRVYRCGGTCSTRMWDRLAGPYFLSISHSAIYLAMPLCRKMSKRARKMICRMWDP